MSGCHQQNTPPAHEPALAASTPKVQPLCERLNELMQNINNQSQISELNQVNHSIKQCLAHMTLAEKTQLIYASTTMYQRFLATERNPEQQQAFEQYAVNNSTNPTLHQQYVASFNPRDRYLIEHQGEAFYELYDAGDGTIMYRRQPKYLLELFAPELPKAEQIFLETLAKQNQNPIFSNGNLDLPWSELSQRAQFWQNYVAQYPNSSFIDDAQRLKFKYAEFLFHGSRNSLISEHYLGETDISPEALLEIKQLAAQNPTVLGQQAQKFLQFMMLSPAERDQSIPFELSPSEQRATQRDVIQTHKQLDIYMKLFDPLALDGTHITRDCLIDAICITHTGKVTNSLIGPTQY
ncbi:hypothetical protein [Acinetobacter sp. MD2]|uniref:hypothetical protein n=1 Tax=Acinetobacter sp. MD2 TaxID=2600066 RepID=UPI002D76A0F3|nr:hypothetical protein [Acinetobacter sp. MD2]